MSRFQSLSFTAAFLLTVYLSSVKAGEAVLSQPAELPLKPVQVQALDQTKGAKTPALGGATCGKLVVRLDPALLKIVVLQPDDLLDASLQINVAKDKLLPEDATLQVCRILHLPDSTGRVLQEGTDFEAQPLATATLPKLPPNDGVIRVSGLADALRRALTTKSDVNLLLRVTGPSAEHTAVPIGGSLEHPDVLITLALKPCAHAELFDNNVKPRPGIYAHFQDGHIFYDGKRLRLWGVVGQPHADRLIKMGFNAQRVWEPSAHFSKSEAGFYSAESLKRGEPVTYTKGDGSNLDEWDKHFAELKAHGIFVMFAALQNGMLSGDSESLNAVLTDDSFIAPGHDPSSTPADWEEWKKAMRTPKLNLARLVMVDERLQAIRKRAAKNLLTHVNQYTGKAYGEDECIAVYEVFNEDGFAMDTLEGGFGNWPPYFQSKLKSRWNAWLKTRYADDAALAAAWGKVEHAESLKDDSVALEPTLGKRAAFPAARAADFIHFILDLNDAFHQDFRAYCRAQAPAGIGVNVAPFSLDTQYRPNAAWNFINSRGEVNSFGMYFWDLDTALNRPPSAYVIDSNSVEGAATILYETNQARPNPCRAEYPLKLAALASWQDWDGVIWHYWGPAGPSDEAYLTAPMPYMNVDHYWTAVHHELDPVMCSAMAIAGRMFLHGEIHPASRPLIAEVGRNALYNYDYYNGVSVSQQTFERGAKLRFNIEKASGVSFDGAPPQPAQRLTGAVRSGDEIIWDWPNARLIIDTPTAKAYVGKFAGPYAFKDGIALSDVTTPFVCFAMVSADGRALTGENAATRINVTAVADARNTDFQFQWDVKGGPVEMAKAIINRGRAPVIVDRVGYSVWFPTTLQGKLVAYDFALRIASEQKIADTNRITYEGATPFMSVLSIEKRGAPAGTPETAIAVAAAKTEAAPNEAAPGGAKGVGPGPWFPVPGLSWSTSYTDAHKLLRGSSLVYTSISPADSSEKPDKTIVLSDAQLPGLLKGAADIELGFSGASLRSVSATFKQPPPFQNAVAELKKQFGTPAEMKEGAQFERSLARWSGSGQNPAVTMTESQGMLKIVFTRN